MRFVHYTYPSFRTLAPSFGGSARSPWSGLETEIDRLFATALSGYAAPAPFRFAVDLYEDKANTYVRAELPGLNRNDINVEMTDGLLTIAAAPRTTAAAPGTTPPETDQVEPAAAFSRTITIADDVQTDKVSAAYENGILTVTLPKREAIAPKKIAVTIK